MSSVQGCLLSLLAYVGGYGIYLIASQDFLIGRWQVATRPTKCCSKITLTHSLLAMVITVVVALVVASIGAYRAIKIEPAQSLREV